jgi:hypothetical protein
MKISLLKSNSTINYIKQQIAFAITLEIISPVHSYIITKNYIQNAVRRASVRVRRSFVRCGVVQWGAA